jgi:hypothetical protein
MSYIGLFPLNEYYNIDKEFCQIKDVIISTNFIIIRTIDIIIKDEGLFQKGIDRTKNPPKPIVRQCKKAYFSISGEKYMLNNHIFKYFQTRGFFNNNNIPSHHTINNILVQTRYFAANGWKDFHHKIYDFNELTKIQNIDFSFNIKLEMVVDCGIFEIHYEDKDNSLYLLYKEYEKIYNNFETLQKNALN